MAERWRTALECCQRRWRALRRYPRAGGFSYRRLDLEMVARNPSGEVAAIVELVLLGAFWSLPVAK